MTDWKPLVEKASLSAYDCQRYKVQFHPPATEEQLCELTSIWKCNLPKEFVSLYRFSNGISMTHLDGSSFDWVAPIGSLSELRYNSHYWFLPEDKDLADRFRPFIDISPDSAGYLISKTGKIEPGIWYLATADIGDIDDDNPIKPIYLRKTADDITGYFEDFAK